MNRTNSDPDILADLRACLANNKYGMGLHIRDLASQAADEIERLRAHIFEVHTKRSCSVCKELNDKFAPSTIDPARQHGR